SAFIAPSGIIVRRLHLFERGVMTESVPLRARRTLFTRLGDWLGLLSLAVTTAAVAGTWRRGGAAAPGGAQNVGGFKRDLAERARRVGETRGDLLPGPPRGAPRGARRRKGVRPPFG